MSPGQVVSEPLTPAAAGTFFANLGEELAWHRRAIAAIAVLVAIMILCRLLLHVADRRRLRFPLAMIAFYLLTIPVRALLGERGLEMEREYVAVAATVGLAFGITAIASIVMFDVLGQKFARMRILRDVATAVTGIVIILVLLHRAGVNLLGLVTTSAVLTAVVGLALQDTLGNVISGIALQMESTLSPGDWVQINEVAGQVSEVRWRSVVIITRNDDMVVLPHSVLAKAVITNSSRPVGWQRRWVHFDVHLRHPPNEVEHVVLAALHQIPNVKQDDPRPDCILHKMEQDHAHYVVRYRLLDLRRDDGTDSEVKKRIWYALRRSGIEIPYPSRNIFVTELNQEREKSKQARECQRRCASLRKVSLFSPLTDEELTHLADGLRVELFAAGETILRQGAPGDSLYLLRRGQVSIRLEHHGAMQELAVLEQNDFFGEMSLLTGEPRRASAEARGGDVECYVIDRALFQEVLSRRGQLVHEITNLLAARQAALAGAAALGDPHCGEKHAALLERVKRFFGIHSDAVAS